MDYAQVFMDKEYFRFREMLCESDKEKFEWLLQDYNDTREENIRLLCENLQLKTRKISKPDISDEYKAGHRDGYEEALLDISKYINNSLGMLSVTDHVMQKMKNGGDGE